MSSLSQLILLVVIITLTFLVCFAAIQVFQILREAHQTLRRINRFLDDPASPLPPEPELVDISSSSNAVIKKKFSSSVKNIRKLFHRSGTPLRPS
jgi:predicted PurR-regulated permease PerM